MTATITTGAVALEHLLGDPWDEGNPLGYGAVLAADERDETVVAAERLLDRYGLNAEFVPRSLGGRLERLDALADVLRAVYRRDPALGLGYGAASFIAATNIWTAGSTDQQHRAAELLCSGGRIAAAYHELEHGNDLAAMSLSARQRDDGWLLTGDKQVITNSARAQAVVVFARTSASQGSRGHSIFLLDRAALPDGALTDLPRFRSGGMRGVRLGGLRFAGCPAGPADLVGGPGDGLRIALRAYQTTRTVLPAMAAGILDTGLAVAVRYARSRRLYGAAVADLPLVRSVVASAYADLLICDCFTRVAARALHLVPGQAAVYASAVKFLVPGILRSAMHRLSVVLGAQFYVREGPHAIFGKLYRDLAPASFGHAARAACQMSVLPLLPRLARRAWARPPAAPDALFKLGGTLPEAPFHRLALADGADDVLATELPSAAGAFTAELGSPRHEAALRAGRIASELADLGHSCARLAPADLTVAASPAAYHLVARYATVLAASACLGIWRHNRDHHDPFIAGTDWPSAVLHRLVTGHRTGEPLPAELSEVLYADLTARCEQQLGLQLRRTEEHASATFQH